MRDLAHCPPRQVVAGLSVSTSSVALCLLSHLSLAFISHIAHCPQKWERCFSSRGDPINSQQMRKLPSSAEITRRVTDDRGRRSFRKGVNHCVAVRLQRTSVRQARRVHPRIPITGPGRLKYSRGCSSAGASRFSRGRIMLATGHLAES
jgi:hypothetical protein